MGTVYLAWQSPAPTRAWYPIGRLDADSSLGPYRFRYVRGAEHARRDAGLAPLVSFPDFHRRYESEDLFPLFRNRILSPEREEFEEYLKALDLTPESADPLEILALTEGRRQTDTFEVFPSIAVDDEGEFRIRFLLHGWRHVPETARKRIDSLHPGTVLRAAIEVDNPATGRAIQLQTKDYHVIGWTPRYLVDDLVRVLVDPGDGKVAASVAKINDSSNPTQRNIIVEMSGRWPEGRTPMAGSDLEDYPS